MFGCGLLGIPSVPAMLLHEHAPILGAGAGAKRRQVMVPADFSHFRQLKSQGCQSLPKVRSTYCITNLHCWGIPRVSFSARRRPFTWAFINIGITNLKTVNIRTDMAVVKRFHTRISLWSLCVPQDQSNNEVPKVIWIYSGPAMGSSKLEQTFVSPVALISHT